MKFVSAALLFVAAALLATALWTGHDLAECLR